MKPVPVCLSAYLPICLSPFLYVYCCLPCAHLYQHVHVPHSRGSCNTHPPTKQHHHCYNTLAALAKYPTTSPKVCCEAEAFAADVSHLDGLDFAQELNADYVLAARLALSR